MASQAKPSRIAIHNILLVTDFSPVAQGALPYAVSLAQRYGATLFLLHVLPTEDSMAAGEEWPRMSDEVRHIAESRMAGLEHSDSVQSIPHQVVIQSGDTWEVICKVLSDKKVDLMVMGTPGHGAVDRLLLGSTAENVIRHATCPVLTVGPQVGTAALKRFAHILFATDFLGGSQRALDYALSLAEQDRAELTLLHVLESKPASDLEYLEWRRRDSAKLRRMVPADMDLKCSPEIAIEIGIPEQEIVRLAESEKADLIVMGCHSGDAVTTHFPWTTLHQVLQQARCPVLTVLGEWYAVNQDPTDQAAGAWFGE